jgi:hypothetical protein
MRNEQLQTKKRKERGREGEEWKQEAQKYGEASK